MNKYFYFQPRNHRMVSDVEGSIHREPSLKPDMNFGIGVGAAIGLATAGGIASIIAGKQAADSQKKAAKLNAASQNYTADLNHEEWLASQKLLNVPSQGGWTNSLTGEWSATQPALTGKGAYANQFWKQNPTQFEDQLGRDAVQGYNMFHQGTDSLGQYRGMADAFAPGTTGARNTTNDIFSGGIQKEMLANFEPVKATRKRVSRSANIDALARTLNDIAAKQAMQGRKPTDSLAGSMLSMQARTAAGDAVGRVDVQNAEEERAINDMALQLRLQNLQLPYQMAQQEINMFNLPQNAYIEQLMKEQEVFNWLRSKGGNPPVRQPVVTPAIAGTGQLVAQGIGQGAGSLADMYFQNQQQDKILAAMQQQQLVNLGYQAPNWNPQPAWPAYQAPAPQYQLDPSYKFAG